MENKMNFDEIWSIMDSSFEENLHRSYEKQKELINIENFKTITYEEENKTLGFLTYWVFDKFRYVEHFAVDKSARGKGIGEKLLEQFMNDKGLMVLEVEPPHTETDIKRIEYYKKFGFVTNDYPYLQPPYNSKFGMTELILMSTTSLNKETFSEVVNTLYTNVYNYKKNTTE